MAKPAAQKRTKTNRTLKRLSVRIALDKIQQENAELINAVEVDGALLRGRQNLL